MADAAMLAQMMADLGVERRDVVSAPEADGRGRDAHIGTHQQAAILAEDQERRTRIADAGDAGGDERAVRLTAWNNPNTFEQDRTMMSLENRYNGQGHRVRLNQALHRDDGSEAIEAQYGEERHMYLQQRSQAPGNYVSKPRKQEEFKALLNGNSTPRSGGGQGHTRGRVAHDRSPNHARAASPRSFGTVRFGPGGQRIGQTAPSQRPVINPGAQAAAMMRAATNVPRFQVPAQITTNVRAAPTSTTASTIPTSATEQATSEFVQHVATRSSSSISPLSNPDVQTRSSSVVCNPGSQTRSSSTVSPMSNPGLQAAAAIRAAANNTSTQQLAQSTPTPAQETYTTLTAPPTTPETGASVTLRQTSASSLRSSFRAMASLASTSSNQTTASPKHDPVRERIYSNQALWYAAHPGEKCDAYHEKYPDRFQYLGEARDKLIRDAIGLAANENEVDISRYVRTHPEREWMVKAAKKARLQVENETENDITAYCAIHPRQKAFIRAAKAVFTPKGPSAAPWGSSAPDLRFPQRDASIINTELSGCLAEDSSASSSANGDSTGDESAETTMSSIVESALGRLAATFKSVAGLILDVKQFKVDAPVNVKLDLTSETAMFDPRELIESIEALAKKMRDRSQGLEGVRLADDGLWEEAE